jgi:hypothetical protein
MPLYWFVTLRPKMGVTEMSVLAQDLFEFQRLHRVAGGALTWHMLQETANRLIWAGVRDFRGGC